MHRPQLPTASKGVRTAATVRTPAPWWLRRGPTHKKEARSSREGAAHIIAGVVRQGKHADHGALDGQAAVMRQGAHRRRGAHPAHRIFSLQGLRYLQFL
jgi:hypothetical protein